MNRKRQFIFLALALFFITTQIFAIPPEIKLTVNKHRGNPGDTIVFKWTIKKNNNRVHNPRVRFDGRDIKAKDSYTWKATPGMHVMYLEMAWKEGMKDLPLTPEEEKAKAKAKKRGWKWKRARKPYLTAVQVVQIKSNKKAHFVHPGMFSSAAELNAIYYLVHRPGSNPVKDSIAEISKVTVSAPANPKRAYASLAWKPDPVKIVWPKSPDKARMFTDGRAVYMHALLWAATGKQAHAKKAIEILNAWSAIFEDVRTKNGDIYNSLFSSWSASHWLAGAEILRYYKNHGRPSGWKQKDILRFEKMCRVFERLMLQWEGGANVSGLQNQRLAVTRTCLLLGIFLNDQDLFDFGIYQIFERLDSGKKTIKKHGHPVNLVELTIAADGEIMEFNRDGAHGRASLNVLVNIAEILRHQNMPAKYRLYDLKFGKDKVPRLLLGSEYAANAYYNGPVKLSFGKEFKNNEECEHSEQIVNYYKNYSKRKYPLPLTEKLNKQTRPKISHSYSLPWSTTTHAFPGPVRPRR